MTYKNAIIAERVSIITITLVTLAVLISLRNYCWSGFMAMAVLGFMAGKAVYRH